MRNSIVTGIVAGLAAMVLSLLYLIHFQEVSPAALTLSTPVLYLLAALALVSVLVVARLQHVPRLSVPDVETRARLKGCVKWFNPSKGFGFIEQNGGQDFFVHQSEIQQNGFRFLNKDERVEFEASVGHKGPIAKNVVRLDGYEPVAEDYQVSQAS